MLREINERIRHGTNTFSLLISEALMQNSKYAELKLFFLSTLLNSWNYVQRFGYWVSNYPAIQMLHEMLRALPILLVGEMAWWAQVAVLFQWETAFISPWPWKEKEPSAGPLAWLCYWTGGVVPRGIVGWPFLWSGSSEPCLPLLTCHELGFTKNSPQINFVSFHYFIVHQGVAQAGVE